MSVLVIDTETTGLPPRGASEFNVSAWDNCRIVQIAWALYSSEGECIKEKCFLIQPDGFTIPDSAQKIHGISTEYAREHGVSRSMVWDVLHRNLNSVQRIVAHNIRFDQSVILSELFRDGRTDIVDLWKTKEIYCTMQKGTRPGEKWPKLIELYKRCFDREPWGTLHRADTDVRVCAEIYFHQQKHS